MTDYGWEYVWHCHLLGHEENDMMRPIAFQPGTVNTYVIPRAPTNVNATLGAGQVTVTFNAATVAAGGTAVTGYTVKSNPGGLVDSNAGSPSLSHIITLPVNNGVHYTFTVTATNSAGPGLPSNPSNEIITPSSLGHLAGVFTNGTWYLDVDGNGAWNGTPTDKTFANFGVGLPNAIPVAGDWDGTGVRRIGVFTNGTWYLDMNGNGAWDGPVTDKTFPDFGKGLPNVMPVVGDWTGTGVTRIGVYTNGTWYLDINGNGAWDGPVTDKTFPQFGLPGWIPVVGNWPGSTGLGDKIGVYANGTWYFDMNGNGAWDGPVTDKTFPQFGLPGWIPVVGDWDNTGVVRIGVFTNGTWYLDIDGNGAWNPGTDTAVTNFGVGLPNVKPIVGPW
jgi:hypothetical protein